MAATSFAEDSHHDAVVIVAMIESTGMLLALGAMTDRKIDLPALSLASRIDRLGTVIGGIHKPRMRASRQPKHSCLL